MSVDPTFAEQNRASTARMRALADRLSDEEMVQPVGEHWTVAVAFVHMAFWDRRVLMMLERAEREGKLEVSEIGDVVNDLSLPFWGAIPPQRAATLAIESAEAVDAKLSEISDQLREDLYTRQLRWVVRAHHRNTHLDDIEQALQE